ncbi:IclR family transcriptional regulator [Streptomyces sp. NPDC055692]|uniref:IclR family transcriptional regulator n=1 Tax=Streptomyces sp. NPDC055692 TaxID=3155683 RepID=UPI0034172501
MDAPSSVVGRAAAVLRALSQSDPGGATTASLGRRAGLPRPTTHRLLSALQGEGFIDRTADGRWVLGPELFLLGAAASSRYDMTEQARPVLRRLAQATGESAFFSVRRGDETVCLMREDGSFPIRSFVLYEGLRLPLGVASAGLAILAFLPDPWVAAYLETSELVSAWGESHAPEPLLRRLQATRKEGYSTNPGLLVEGSWGMGAAVFDAQGRPTGALSLTGIEQRFSAGRRPQLGRLLLDEAHRLTGLLARGGSQPRPPTAVEQCRDSDTKN